MKLALVATSLLLTACGSVSLAPAVVATPHACDDGLKTAFHPDAQTKVVEVRPIAKGTQLVAVDSSSPITTATDMCLVKLLVGPGVAAEQDKTAKSYSEGIGIEVWLPAHDAWNERIRNYGGGGWVGGGHRYPGQTGSKVPAIVNANMGYASGTHDGGQPWYQDSSFTFLSNGKVNLEGMRDMATRSIQEQALKTRALVNLYYGRQPRFAYYDGHSQGGRQGLKVAQEWPELYDGYLIAQPAVSAPHFGLASLYPQLVMKSELGINALDKPAAAAFAKKVAAANARAVASCDREQLGFLLDPASCGYSPQRDAAALCAGAAGAGDVVGTNADAATCLSAREALALDKIWYGPTADGSYDPAQTADARNGKARGPRQLWWGFPRGSSLDGVLTGASTDMLALALGDLRYAASAAATSAIPLSNAATAERNRWSTLTYASYADAYTRGLEQPFLREFDTDQPDLSRLRALGRKMILWNGLAEDVIPPAGAVNYYERVQAALGGEAATQSFFRMYLVPGLAHSSQGRPATLGGNNNAVPLPRLPGNANQTPSRDQDTMFTALVDWVERGAAPGDILLVSRDNSVNYPICVYPKKAVWDGSGSAKVAASYACR